MSEIKSSIHWQRLAPRLLATACLVMFAHAAGSQTLPGPDAIPYVTKEARDRWERYVLAKANKAYAVSESGAWAWRQGFEREEDAKAAALSSCERFGSPCFVYAVNQTVVWEKGKVQTTPTDERPAAAAAPAPVPAEEPRSGVSPLQGTKLMVGRFSFPVPEGPWMVGSYFRTPPGGDAGNQIVEAYGHLSGPDGQFKAAFLHGARREPLVHPNGKKVVWADATCDRSDAIIADRMRGEAGFPECLMLDFLPTAEAASGEDGKIRRWIRANGIEFQGPVISATYVKYKGGDFVRVVYWINPAALGVPSSQWDPRNLDARFIERLKAWSYEMASSGRASLDNRAPTAVTLPPFPDPGQSPSPR
jgi:hypothetical protein